MITSAISPYWRVSVVDLTGSTQEDLANLVNSSNATSGELIAAEFQSAGRGRLDRTFEAPTHSALLFSFYLEPQRSRDDWGFIAMLSALSMRDVISKSVTNEVFVKWPNDILIGEKKVAGLITQATARGVIVGIGLNVEMNETELPVPTAISLAQVESTELNRNQILISFLNCFEADFKDWDSGANFIDKYAKVSATLGCEIQVEVLGRPIVKAIARSITSQGALVMADGSQVTVGDVVHLR